MFHSLWTMQLLLFVTTFWSCKHELPEAPFLNVETTEISFTAEPFTRIVRCSSNAVIAVESSQPSWCSANVIAGSKNSYDIEISVKKNTLIGGQGRLAYITVSAGNAKPVIIEVKQNASSPVPGMSVYGWVSCNNTGVPGVVVSDGYEVTVTDADGVYYLPSQKRNGYVFISVPGNYELPEIDNVPQFFKRLTTNASTAERHDFELTETNNEQHTVFAVADWHLANRTNDIAQFNTCLADINSVINSYKSAGSKTYVLTLGDMTWDGFWYSNSFALPQYITQMKRLNAPVFSSMGNHDNDPYNAGDWLAELTFKNVVGRTWYSFNLGKVH